MAVQTYKKNSDVRLSKNFHLREFTCHGSGCGCAAVKVDTKLVEFLQKIRDHFGKPVNISSAYRCSVWNKAVGGVSGSRHLRGEAADISIAGVAPKEIAKYAESIGVKGIGLYMTPKDGYFVHVDTRTAKSFWYGHAQAYRSTFGGTAPADTDGYSRTDFVKEVQRACGAAVDGFAGAETLRRTVTLSAKKNATHAAVRAVQRYLKELGYAVGTVDGIAGAKFTAAVKAYQKAQGCVQDGEITAQGKTWKKLLGMA